MARRLKAIAGGQTGPAAGPLRLALMAAVTAVFCGLLWSRLSGVEAGAVMAALAQLSPLRWAAALAATAVSFWAVGRYDDAVHRHLATGVPAAQARRAGSCGIALSQLLGLGPVTGALVRWRMLPSLGLAQAARLTLAVSVLFLAGWALVTAVAILVLGGPYRPAAGMALGVAAAVAGLSLLQRGLRGMPNLLTLARMVGLAAVDCLGAVAAFWCLWPAAPALDALVPAVLVALGLGLVSGTPGGIGAFELALLAHLPDQPQAGLLAAVLAWRAVYVLMPAAVATLAVLRGPRAARRADVAAAVPAGLPFPEAALMRQGVFGPLVAGSSLLAAARTPHALVALREPLSGSYAPLGLKARAEREARIAVVYKAPPRVAAAARRAGMAVLPLAREAWLDPGAFALECPRRAALRRKLRRAAQAGVSAQCEAADTADLARINVAWAAARGGEQGFSMGRFDPGYLAGQRVYVARQGLRPVGFASFHATPAGWALDLLRPHPEAPDGTAHVLMAAALADAARAGVRRLSLAAVPEPAFAASRGRILAGLIRLFPGALRAARGLWQFKECFAPRWERLYIIAPSLPAMALAGWDIRRAVTRPGPLPAAVPAASRPTAPPVPDMPIASPRASWQMGRR